jgi:hypothetical protein
VVDVVDPAAPRGSHQGRDRHVAPRSDPLDAERHRLAPRGRGLSQRLLNTDEDADDTIQAVVRMVREAYGHHLVVACELRGDRLTPALRGPDLADRTT